MRGALPARLLYHDVADVLGTERLQLGGLGAKARVEKTPDRGEGGRPRGGCQATLVAQGVLKGARAAVAPTLAGFGKQEGQPAVRAELREQSP